MAAGDVAGAMIELKNAIRSDPASSEARFELGRLYLQAGNAASARLELEAAQAHGVDRAKLVVPLSETYLAQGRARELTEKFKPDDFSGGVKADLLAVNVQARIVMNDLRLAKILLDEATSLAPTSIRVLIAAAWLARAQGRYADETKFVDQALASDPENHDLLVLKVQGMSRDNDTTGALQLLDQMITKNPLFPQARILRATINISRGKVDLVADDAAAILQEDPDSSMGIYLHAFLLSREGKYRDAMQELLANPHIANSYAPARYLEAVTAFAENQFQTALGYAESYVNKVPDDVLGVKLLARIALRVNESDRAIRALEPATAAYPDDNQLRLELASAYSAAGRPDDAAKLFQRSLDQDTHNNQLRLALATNELRSGATDAGIAELQTVIAAAPDSLQANIELAMAHVQRRQFDKALETADAMIKANPRNPVAYVLRGTISMAANDLVSAENSFKAALNQKPKYVPAILSLAHVDEHRNDMDGAKQRYREAIAIDPTNTASVYGLVDQALREKKPEDAAQVLEDAVARNRKNPEPRLRLVDLDLSIGHEHRALVVARDLANDRPDDPRALDALARVELTDGDVTNAVASYKKLVSIEPRNPEAARRLAAAFFTAANTPPGPPKNWDPNLTHAGLETLNDALAWAPDFSAILADRLAIERQLNGDAAALDLAQKYVDDRPGSMERLIAAGDLALAVGKDDLAAASYRSVWDRVKSVGALERLSAALMHEKKDDEVLRLLTAWAADHPTDYKIRFAITGEYMKTGQIENAISETEALNKAIPNNPLLLNNLATFYDERNDPRAIEYAQRAFEAGPNIADVVDTLGWLETNKRDTKKGAELLAKSHDLAPQDPVISYHYAVALERTGDRAKAKEVLKAALENKTPFPGRAKAESLMKALGG